MTNDNTKGAFAYDYRNMPLKVVTNDTVIEYAYDAAGQRIKKKFRLNGVLLDSVIYVRNGSNVLAEYRNNKLDHYNIYGNGLIGKLVPTPKTVTIGQTVSGQTITAKDTVYIVAGGRINSESMVAAVGNGSTNDKRYYYLSDHLGSIRVVLNDTGGVDSWSDYYPFGKEARGSSTSNEPKEQFTGKERDIEIGLDYFGARYYNTDIGRWTSNEPYNSKYPHLSGYAYSANNPIILVDINGFEWKLSERAMNNPLFMYMFNIYQNSDYGKARLEYLHKAEYLTYIDWIDKYDTEGEAVTFQMPVENRRMNKFDTRQVIGTVYYDDIENETGVGNNQDLVVIYLNFNALVKASKTYNISLLLESILTLNHEIEAHAIYDPKGVKKDDHIYWKGVLQDNLGVQDHQLTGDVPGAKAARILKQVEIVVNERIKEDEERKKRENAEQKQKEQGK